MRRHDPGRRDRIVKVTLDLIAEVGVAGVSHRGIAHRADVPLGSMTYHFDGMDDLLRTAFARFAERFAASYAAHFAEARTRDEAIAAVVALVRDLSADAGMRDNIIAYELYMLAARDPAYREITGRWMAGSRSELERWFAPDVARQLDALIEGFALHGALDVAPLELDVVASAVSRLVGA
ncbi:TetR/AcrR family transcriptional regulator [Demequina gelatinilytica]|uniref:TetR/AcrR family transcriptional regulator n=1 Tax=Demequina gelatinilytica TaxID=1638980 RepID=UPI000782CC09|nr:TetR family transcriptional regulator [Demequina gelatinilytica]